MLLQYLCAQTKLLFNVILVIFGNTNSFDVNPVIGFVNEK